MIFAEEHKAQPIARLQAMEAFKGVRANGGSAGVDSITVAQVESSKRKYLYPLWSRVASGSCFPQPARQRFIPKEGGRKRALGIPTITDRVAQQVIATELGSIVDKHFSRNPFGYRRRLPAHDAVEQCRISCMKYSWGIDPGIKGFFDSIDHELLMKALRHHTDRKHTLLCCERWLKAPVQRPDGTLKRPEGKGAPQGGAISPGLANIFLDIVLDEWMGKSYPDIAFERYADDIVAHCHGIKGALRLLEAVKRRLKDCKLELNSKKPKVVYCRRNQKKRPPFNVRCQKFDFLGFTFTPRIVKERGKIRLGFTPAISQKSVARISEELLKLNIHRWVQFPLSRVAELLKAKRRGWPSCYSKLRKPELRRLFRAVNLRLTAWVRNEYRKFRRRHWYNAYRYLKGIAKSYPNMFEHWKYGFPP